MRSRIVLLSITATALVAACAHDAECPAVPSSPPAPAMPSACEVGAPERHAEGNGETSPRAPAGDGAPLSTDTTMLSETAVEQVKQALRADVEGRLDDCISYDREALKLGDNARVYVHVASCETRKGKLVEALRDAQKALESGIKEKDASVMKIARARVQQLLATIPSVHFVSQPTPGTEVLKLSVDDKVVNENELRGKNFSLDPGEHVVKVTSVRGDKAVIDQCRFTIAQGTRVPITIR